MIARRYPSLDYSSISPQFRFRNVSGGDLPTLPMPRLSLWCGVLLQWQRDRLFIFGFDDPEAVGCTHALARRGYVSKNGTRYAAVEWADGTPGGPSDAASLQNMHFQPSSRLTSRAALKLRRTALGVFLPVQTCAQLAIHFETLILQPA
jgi:hypothetical protein